MRPPGYEPGELPTAPLRDIFKIGCKGTAFFAYMQEKAQKSAFSRNKDRPMD